MQVGHGKVESSVRSAEDVRVTDSFLQGDGISGDHRFAVVQGSKCISVVTDGHVKAVRFVFMEDHQVSTHVLFLWDGVTVTELTEAGAAFSGGKQSDA